MLQILSTLTLEDLMSEYSQIVLPLPSYNNFSLSSITANNIAVYNKLDTKERERVQYE